MYKPFLHILFCLLTSALRAQQNLVPNPSFEEVSQCPDHREDFTRLEHWTKVGGTPDIHHSCMNHDVYSEIPLNDFGWQWPRTGESYVGFHLNPPDVREYFQCKLMEQLEVGESYVVQFFVSHADSSTTACDNVGVLLSAISVSSTNNEVLPYTPQVTSPMGQPITDDVGWVRIMDTLIADGSEQYLTIGVFSNDESTTFLTVPGGWDADSHYYVDDVSLVKLTRSIEVPNVFTPNGDGLNDRLQIGTTGYLNGKMSIYNRWGVQVFSQEGTSFEWDGRINGADGNAGIYYLVVSMFDEMDNGIIEKGFVHLLR